MKILIGYDGSDLYGEIILDDLKRAGLPADTEATLMIVADVREIPTSPFLAERISSQIEYLLKSDDKEVHGKLDKHLEIARSDALDVAHKIKENFPDWNVETEAVFGKPAVELIKKADKMKPDILVVGSHGRSAIGRLFLGSVSQKILTEAHCSVRISRPIENKENANPLIFVAVDGSVNAEAAVKTVANRQWSKETEIRLIAADDPFNRSEVGYLDWDHLEDKPKDCENSRKWIEKVIEKPAQILSSAGLQVSHKIVWGDAANMILEEIKDSNADAIFLGARGLGRVKRFLLGSVSSRVAAQAECPVEIIRINEADKTNE